MPIAEGPCPRILNIKQPGKHISKPWRRFSRKPQTQTSRWVLICWQLLPPKLIMSLNSQVSNFHICFFIFCWSEIKWTWCQNMAMFKVVYQLYHLLLFPVVKLHNNFTVRHILEPRLRLHDVFCLWDPFKINSNCWSSRSNSQVSKQVD